jgi:hypothetical protein
LRRLDAFFTDYHAREATWTPGISGEIVWIACPIGASMARRMDDDDPAGRA